MKKFCNAEGAIKNCAADSAEPLKKTAGGKRVNGMRERRHRRREREKLQKAERCFIISEVASAARARINGAEVSPRLGHRCLPHWALSFICLIAIGRRDDMLRTAVSVRVKRARSTFSLTKPLVASHMCCTTPPMYGCVIRCSVTLDLCAKRTRSSHPSPLNAGRHRFLNTISRLWRSPSSYPDRGVRANDNTYRRTLHLSSKSWLHFDFAGVPSSGILHASLGSIRKTPKDHHASDIANESSFALRSARKRPTLDGSLDWVSSCKVKVQCQPPDHCSIPRRQHHSTRDPVMRQLSFVHAPSPLSGPMRRERDNTDGYSTSCGYAQPIDEDCPTKETGTKTGQHQFS